jgi:ketosteroid isomerase-like protein
MPRSDLERFIDRYHSALEAFFLAGDAEPVKRLFSRRERATLANPFGAPARGWAEIEPTIDRAVANYRDAADLSFDHIAEDASDDLAYIFEIERVRARVGGSDELASVALRVTTVMRREEGEWRIDHRHADPISGSRPPESVIER